MFLPKVDGRVIEIHGGAIPRPKPRKLSGKSLGDVTGNIKTFTGGGIFGISMLIGPLIRYIAEGDGREYENEYRKLSGEIEKQFKLTSVLEKTWKLALLSARLFNGKTIRAYEEFDFHSLLPSIPH